jgi:tyrosine-protein kinase Etk/Wzc
MQMTLKGQELQVLKAGELGNVRVIDYPVVPLKRSKPSTAIVLVLGTLLMGMLSVLYILVRISLDRAIYNPQQIETYLNLPVYATIPMSPNQAKLDKQQNQAKPLLYQLAHDDPAIEALRFLRTSMETGNLRIKKHSVIGITGPSPDVGKSFISANLSSLIAELGSKILLIDGDIRKGVLHDYYNAPRETGLADYLSGQAQANEIIKSTANPHLDIITRGALPGNPSVLMNSMKLEELLEFVKPRYDFVLIDTPPALSVTDAAVVARYCDRLVIVLRAGKTTIEEVSTCWNRLSHSGVTPSGLVMSGFDAKSYGYGVYKHYGYY